jgi:riboflavin kinase/FMN adenylyltransferase
MKILKSARSDYTRGAACGLGSFDGIHQGHRQIIERLKTLARGRCKTGIITFSVLPASVVKPAGIYYLTTNTEKERIIASLSIDFIFYFEFTHEFAGLAPKAFIELVFAEVMPSVVVVGENFHFGRHRKGTAKTLEQLARGRFAVEIFPAVRDSKETISSTRIRELLLLGNIPAANRLLGREYTIIGRVVKGRGRGRRLGFPTINIEIEEGKLLPLDGVYAVQVDLEDRTHDGAMFCAHNSVEVHILDFAGEIYGLDVTVRIAKRIRDVDKFKSDDLLREAIARDVMKVAEGRGRKED